MSKTNVNKKPAEDTPEGWDDVSLPEWLAGLDHPKKWLTPLYLASSEYYELGEVESQIAGLRALIANRPDQDGESRLGDEDEAAEQIEELVARRDVLRPIVRESERKVRVCNPFSTSELLALVSEHTTQQNQLDDQDELLMKLLAKCQVEPKLPRAGWEKLIRAVGVGQSMQLMHEILGFVQADAVSPDFLRPGSEASRE